MQKLYCYVDESGQDTKGGLFIVAIIVLEKDRELLLSFCEEVERRSGKGKFKWGKAKHDLRMQYLRQIFSDDRFKGNLRYSLFRESTDYDAVTVMGIAKAIYWSKLSGKYTSLVYIDGLSKTKRREYSVQLRRLGLRIHQVRGIARDESNALTRLADAIAGFVRDAMEADRGDIKSLFQEAKRDRVLIEV
jgi:hypothetical protein